MNNINKIRKYLIEVKNISPLRIGNGEDEGFQLLLAEDRACISGTTMAGLFRSFLDKKSNSNIRSLIYDPTGEPSCIFFYDSLSEEIIDRSDIECRPHIRIDEKTETAVPGALFSECHISEGKTFKIIIEVKGFNIAENKDKDTCNRYEEICERLEKFLYLLGNGQISIGSKSTFGFGRMEFSEENSCYLREFDLTDEKDLEDYLNDVLPDEKIEFKDINVDNKNIDIILKAYCKDGLIIKGKKEKMPLKDKSQGYKNVSYGEMKNNKFYVIPSSTVKGIVYNYSKKIFATLEKDIETLNKIFGEKTNEREGKIGKKGNIIFYDYKVKKDNVKNTIYNRIKIDRFTGGAFPGSLFKDEVIIFNEDTSKLEFKVSIKKSSEQKIKQAIALVILTFRDMGFGYVTVGSGNNVGFGRLQGLSISLDNENNENFSIEFKDNKLTGDTKKFNEYIKTLNE